MKNNIIIIITIMAVTLSSCGEDFLSPAPISSIGSETFYSNESELETGVINMYDGIQGINSTSTNDKHAIQVEYQLTEMRSDNTRTKSSEGESAQFESFSVVSTNGVVADYYSSYYNIIFRANIVLENLGVATTKADQYEGEAKFVRAYAYFNLVRLFGDIPLAITVIPPTDDVTAFTRKPVSEVYDFIISDLVTAEAKLSNNNSTMRATKAAAQALLAKVYLTVGRYSDARTMCENVINSGDYALEPNFKDVFYNERNNEVIWAVEFIPDNNNDSQNFSAEWLNAVGRSSGLNYVTNEAIAALDALGGNRTMFSYRPDAAQANQYQVVKYLPNGDSALGIDPTSSDPTLAGNDWIVLRYADVLLMHAEAILGSDPITTDAAAIASMQAVRDRAGLTTPLTSVFKQDLLDERRVELAFENHRWFDLQRFGVAEQVLSQFANDNDFIFSATDLLLPIPQREIGLSKGKLSQNPGY